MNPLARKARLAVLWNTGFSLFRDVLQFGVMVVLVRLLTPDDYGQFGLVTALVGWLYVFSFRSFLAHTLQIRRDEDVDYSLHLKAGAVINAGMFVATNVLAFALRWSETYAPISVLLHVMSVSFVLDVTSEIRVKMLERALDWRRLRLLHAVGLLINAGLSIALALAGAGVYALLLPTLFVPLPFMYDLFVRRRWRPAWKWSAERFRPAWRFGAARVLSGSVVTGRHLLQSGVLVPLVGYAELGFFGRATGLAQLFTYRFAFLLLQSIYPVLTRFEPGSAARERTGALVLGSVGWLVIPVGALVAVLAQPIVAVVYGGQWLQVIPILPWAMASGVAGAVAHAAYMLLLASHRETRCLIADVWVLLGTAASLLWLVPQGLGTYLLGLAVIHMCTFALLVYWLLRDHAMTVAGAIQSIVPPVIATGCALLSCEIVRRGSTVGIDTFLQAAAYGSGFLLLYVLFLRILFAPRMSELLRYLPGADRVRRLLALGNGDGIHHNGQAPR